MTKIPGNGSDVLRLLCPIIVVIIVSDNGSFYCFAV
jgi:hypothetical protein